MPTHTCMFGWVWFPQSEHSIAGDWGLECWAKHLQKIDIVLMLHVGICWFSRGYDMRHDQEMDYVAILIDGHQSILRSLLHSTESKMMVGWPFPQKNGGMTRIPNRVLTIAQSDLLKPILLGVTKAWLASFNSIFFSRHGDIRVAADRHFLG